MELEGLSLVILTFRFEAIRELHWNGPRYFKPRSDDEADPRAGIPLPSFHTKAAVGRLTTTYYLTCTGPIHDGSSVESGFEVETLSLCH
ncbi:hypothetical protein AVEN_97592-1 [Araneus ventricosus]|uniref:Uncharacterized protein n=1 Tax=Araneus ventricosus TaxID=182803 RepID=A0A4Y2F3X6_ARAVE|nr:hypothetical protein AVEN_97592-1 [Araneus ventricosus]